MTGAYVLCVVASVLPCCIGQASLPVGEAFARVVSAQDGLASVIPFASVLSTNRVTPVSLYWFLDSGVVDLYNVEALSDPVQRVNDGNATELWARFSSNTRNCVPALSSLWRFQLHCDIDVTRPCLTATCWIASRALDVSIRIPPGVMPLRVNTLATERATNPLLLQTEATGDVPGDNPASEYLVGLYA